MRAFTLRRWLMLLAAAVAVLLILLPGVAGAFSSPKVTVDETIGGVPTRFTFEGVIDPGDSMTELDLTFPDGFDLTKARVESLTLDGLNRVPVEPKVSIAGQSVKLVFNPPVESGSKVLTLRVVTYEVMTPNEGATYTMKASYVAGGAAIDIPGLTFSYSSPSTADRLARWMDGQGWVHWINSIKAVNLFVQPQLIVRSVPLLFWGWMMSIALVLLAFPLAIVVGLMWAFAKMSKIPPLRWLASAYINVIRGTPLFLQIFIAFIGLRIAGIRVNDFLTAIIVLALNSSAYLAEIFRAGIQSIHKGQMEAAVSLGLNYAQAMRYVIIPQTVKRVLPTMTSEFILLFKDTALLSSMGIFELMLRANNLVARVGNLTPFVVAAVYYLVVTIPLINYVGRLERRLAVAEGGGGAAGGRKKRGTLLPSPKPAGEVE
jgi:polar amino acid transport system substrate-binding protein